MSMSTALQIAAARNPADGFSYARALKEVAAMIRLTLAPCFALALVLLASMPLCLQGQARGFQGQAREIQAMILPAPIYPPGGFIDQRFAEQFVFFDHETRDLVLAYPPVPGSPRVVHRLELPTHVAPEILATVSKEPTGGYRYDYVVANGPTSRQPIRTWFLSVPPPVAPDPTKAVPRDEDQGRAWVQSFYSYRPGEWAVRFDSRPEAPLSPNQSTVFVVDNDNRPGLVSAYFQGAVSSVNVIPDDLPQAARQQLERLQGLEHNSKAIWTIGPKYGETVSSIEIAADFQFAFTRLVRQRALDRDSPFVNAVSARLKEFIEQPRPPDAEPRVDEPFPPIEQSPNSMSTIERQLDLALKLALVRP